MASFAAFDLVRVKEFEIEIASLQPGTVKNYVLEVHEAFFSAFSPSIAERGNLRVDLELSKSETMITTRFHIKGTVELICDRSLEPFDEPIDVTHRVIFKFGEEAEELDDDLFVIPRDAHYLSLGQHVYDFIGLAIPMRKLHPDCRTEDDETAQGFFYQSSTQMPEEASDDDASSDKAADPRWDALRALRDRENLN
ncbi:Uncharacterized metal-binding protein YceD, DUF177 family [Catalinimonas alkaloidigena]|uniref:Uncharacterized metal-binding protein YceD, DUF177 family n=1 Tax=Catalinimonas alkaloidigena TaxID=1075417 RepID=A0A1G8WFW0_9BACT|nr:DUF177 domain-containing protein [Catalinimonas alkaloidigena]SDJ76977.1 Uncharacterized metal-binding protein YceD, DUF177 family [Catalinimonas alkaloidigena]